MTSADVAAAEKQLESASAEAAIQFLQDHAAAVQVLGADKVKAFLDAAVHAVTPLPVLPPNPTPEQIANVEEAVNQRRTTLDLTAEAEATDAALAAQLKTDAIATAKKLGGMVMGVALSFGAKAVLGI